MSAPFVSILIVTYNAGPHLGRCLEALSQQTYTDFEVIIVDNGSTDGWIEATKPFPPFVTFIESGANLGFAAGNNFAAKHAKGDWFATLNADAYPAPEWLDRLVEATDRYPWATVFGSTQLLEARPELLDGSGDSYHPLGLAWRGNRLRPVGTAPPDGEVFGPCAAAALYRRDVFEEVGGFDERFFCYYEDVDLAFRLRLMGRRSVQVRSACVRHVGSAVTGEGSDFARYHVARNRFWMVLRDTPGGLMWVVLPSFLAFQFIRLLVAPLVGDGMIRVRAIRDAMIQLPAVLRQRNGLHSRRRANALNIARAMTWSPYKLLTGTTDVRPLHGADRSPVRVPDGREGSVAGVIVSYQPDAIFEEAVSAVLDQVDRLYIVDNGSGADILSRIEGLKSEAGDRIIPILNADNVGLATAQNQGIVRAVQDGNDWVLLLDHDSVPEPGMVDAMLDVHMTHPDRDRIGLVAPRLYDENATLRSALYVSRGPFDLRRHWFGPGEVVDDVIFAIASGSLIPASVLREVGAMRDEFFIDYIDIEFALRLRRAGYKIVGVGDALMRHQLGAFQRKQLLGRDVPFNSHSASRRYFIYRNRIRVWWEYGVEIPAYISFELVAVLIDLGKLIFLEDDKTAKLKGIFRGIRDAIRGRRSTASVPMSPP